MLLIILFPLLLLMTIFELVKRIIGIFIYPFSYCLRQWPVTDKSFWWLWMDDSIVVDSIARGYGPLEYCGYGKKEPLDFITERLPAGKVKEFMRGWNWGAWRNSAINLAITLEKAVGPMQSVMQRYGGKSFCEVRRFKNFALPYLEIWIGRHRLQVGWITCGRFQVSFLKK